MTRFLSLLALSIGCGSPQGGQDSSTPSTTETTPLPVVCTPPTRLVLDQIPDDPGLEGAPNAQVVFEVEGDQLIGKWVRNTTVADGALDLWQELVLRIPTNQRTQLVQFTVYDDSGLAGFVNNGGTENQTGRYGPSLSLHSSNIEDNDPDPCAPLSGHRGTFDWTLIHEFGHLRQYADGTVDDYVGRFGNQTGEGLGYPEDGSPRLDGDWVSSYAERAGGDEDAAESFTAYVMLDALPTDQTGAGDKVRFFDEQADYRELRQALRVTEPGGGGAVPDAPTRAYALEIDNPDWMLGTWEGDGPNGPVSYAIEAHEIVFTETVGPDVEVMDYAHLRDDGTLATIQIYESSESFHLHQVAVGSTGFSESFVPQGNTLLIEREHTGMFTVTRAP